MDTIVPDSMGVEPTSTGAGGVPDGVIYTAWYPAALIQGRRIRGARLVLRNSAFQFDQMSYRRDGENDLRVDCSVTRRGAQDPAYDLFEATIETQMQAGQNPFLGVRWQMALPSSTYPLWDKDASFLSIE